MKNIAVISGGYSHEAVISKESVKTILANLDTSLFNLYHVIINEEGWNYKNKKGELSPVDRNDFSVLVEGEKIQFDFAYIIIHGTPGEDGKLQSYFDILGIPYSTPNHLATTITFNKWACNTLLTALGYKCAASIIVRKNQKIDTKTIVDKLGLPIFVKPCDGGSSYGVSRVVTQEEIEKAISEAFDHGTEVIIESELKGVEITNGIFKKSNQELHVLPITEIVSENDFFDFEAKYEGKSKEITPARISHELTDKVYKLTELIYQDLGLSGIVRIDYIIQEGEPYVIEVNTTPGMSKESVIPQQVIVDNLILKDVLTEVVKQAFV